MVWAIGTRLILSNAQKSAGTNGPNHAGRLLVGSAMKVGARAIPVLGFAICVLWQSLKLGIDRRLSGDHFVKPGTRRWPGADINNGQ
jgi:hypothetical protein